MLSILIPVYNYDVRGLVLELVNQIKKVDNFVEIQLLDDGSESKWSNQLEDLTALSEVSLYSFKANKGRVASRKKLAELANYDYLLFIDCDAIVVSENYLTNYLNNIPEAKVIAGGHIYQEQMPDVRYKLHWEYGRRVEARSVGQRLEKPYASFSTFNFCITKEVFINNLYNIKIDGYGHEDTVMGYALCKNNVIIRHIDNPLLHAGLKDTDQFLKDTAIALQNALFVLKDYPDIDIKVIRYARALESIGLKRIMISFLKLLDKGIDANLKSENPNLRYLQLYKLKTYLQLTILSAEATAKEGGN